MAENIKTSINIKKFWYSELASDGGVGSQWKPIEIGQREGTVQLQGSDATVTNFNNVLGNPLESKKVAGDVTMNCQLADLTPSVIADFTGGTVVDSTESVSYEMPDNRNQVIELSVMFLTDKNVVVILPRCSFDGYPVFNDDDLHYYQLNSTVLLPEKVGENMMSQKVIKSGYESANDILTFVLDEQTGAATIDTGAHTVAIEVANGTSVTALIPTITTSLGSGIDPYSGKAQDFTSPVEYTVTAADGTTQVWTVTVTVAV